MEANQPEVDEKQRDRKKSVNADIEKKRKEIEQKEEQAKKKEELLAALKKDNK